MLATISFPLQLIPILILDYSQLIPSPTVHTYPLNSVILVLILTLHLSFHLHTYPHESTVPHSTLTNSYKSLTNCLSTSSLVDPFTLINQPFPRYEPSRGSGPCYARSLRRQVGYEQMQSSVAHVSKCLGVTGDRRLVMR